MTTPSGPPASTEPKASPHRLAMGLTLTAAVFSAVVIGIMAATYMDEPHDQRVPVDLIDGLREHLARQPADERLKAQIRELDRQVRERYFRYRRRFEIGAYLLLAGLIGLVAAARWQASLRVRGPRVPRRADLPAEADTWWTPARQNATAVAVAGLVVGGTLWALGRRGTEQPAGLAQRGAAATAPSPPKVEFRDHWPQFRGPTGLGLVPEGRWPTTWDGPTGRNILWKCAVPLPGNSSPIIWADRVYVTGADARRRAVYAIDRASGRIVWSREIPSSLREPPEVFEETGYAAPTPATNGRFVVALFATADVVGLDAVDGRIVWSVYLGPPHSAYGLASSLVAYKDLVIVQLDMGSDPAEGRSSLVGLDMATGRTVFQTPRPVPNSWSTPIVVRRPEGDLVVACANPWVIGYEAGTGVELWRAKLLTGDIAPMPVYADGRLYVTNDQAQAACLRLGGQGDVTATHVVWTASEGMPDTASPVCDGRRLLQARGDGLVTCLDAATGHVVWEKTFEAGFKASPALVGGKLVYLSDEEGVTHLFELGDACQVRSTGRLGEKQNASIGFGDGQLYIRGVRHLFAVGETP